MIWGFKVCTKKALDVAHKPRPRGRVFQAQEHAGTKYIPGREGQ